MTPGFRPAGNQPVPHRGSRWPITSVALRMMSSLRPGHLWLSGYSTNKLWMDPVYRMVLPLIPPGADVLDLGCGVGLLGMLLAARGHGNRTHGIEWDAHKAQFAQRMERKYPCTTVVQGDLMAEPWPPCSVVVLQDVLHYFPPEQQEQLLARIADHLPKGGRLVLRVMDGGTEGTASLVRLVERLAVRIGWNRASRVHWRPLEDVRGDILRQGMALLATEGPAHRSHGNCILVGEKGASG